jgi:hypothetical protein
MKYYTTDECDEIDCNSIEELVELLQSYVNDIPDEIEVIEYEVTEVCRKTIKVKDYLQ